ncbi:uncharacterized protein LOC128280758 [Gossypium arboreum]|uniref:uncharacterized protein LOC128280758 n=1 Tax=Gossypium arboreum TaxID=29729 RepID=UPI0022F1C72A|nr:uncharacterized protein LOC128280758 [Gossypium arboreum]
MRQDLEETPRSQKLWLFAKWSVGVIFTRIMACDSPKQAWDRLKEEFMGSEKTSRTVDQFEERLENLKMKELLGDDFAESVVVEKARRALEGPSKQRPRELQFKSKSKKPWLEKRRSREEIQAEKLPTMHSLQEDHTFEKFIGEDRMFNVGNANNLVMLRSFAGIKAKYQHNKIEHELLKMFHSGGACLDASCLTTTKRAKCGWLVDSGAFASYGGDVSLFKELDRSFSSRIRIGNGNLIEARGKGDVLISSSSGNKLISDVLYVPDIDQNLLSVGQLVEKGYSLIFKNGSCVIKDFLGQETATVPMADKCFMLDVSQLEKKAYSSQSESAGLWHKRLGHVNFKSLDLLHRLGLAKDMTKVEPLEGVCDVCHLQASKKAISVDQARRAREKLELVHSTFVAR